MQSSLPPGFCATKLPLHFLESPHSGKSHGYCDVPHRPAAGPELRSPKADKWVSPQFDNTATPRRKRKEATKSRLRRHDHKSAKKSQKPAAVSTVSSLRRSQRQQTVSRKPALTLVSTKLGARSHRCARDLQVASQFTECVPSAVEDHVLSPLSERSANCTSDHTGNLPLHKRVRPDWLRDVRQCPNVGKEDADPRSVLVAETPHGHGQHALRRLRPRAADTQHKAIPPSPCTPS
eukprot:scpid52783/ scgid8552/ 